MAHALDILTMAQKTGVEVGAWLAARRKDKGLSQDDLALKMGMICSRQYIGQLEANSYPREDGSPMQPAIAILEAMAEALDAPINELRNMFGYPPDDRGTSEQELTAREFSYALSRYHDLPVPIRNSFRKLVNQIADTLIELHTSESGAQGVRKGKTARGALSQGKGALPADIPEITLEGVRELHKRQKPRAKKGPTKGAPG